jgi:hypothetical protein
MLQKCITALVIASAILNIPSAHGDELETEKPSPAPYPVSQGHFTVKFGSAQDYLYQHYVPSLHGYRSIGEVLPPHWTLHPSYARPLTRVATGARWASWLETLPRQDKRLWDVDAFLRGETDTLNGYDPDAD